MAVTVWVWAVLDVVAERAARRDTRPLLRGKDPVEVLSTLAEARYPFYAQADLTVHTGEGAHRDAVRAVIAAVRDHYARAA